MVKLNPHNFSQHELWTGSLQPGIKSSIHELAPHVAIQLEFNLKTEWDTINLAAILNILLDCDIPVETLMKYGLGRLVKGVSKKASQNLDTRIAELSSKLMGKWRKLLAEDQRKTEGHHAIASEKRSAVLRLTDGDASSSITGPKPACDKTTRVEPPSNASPFFSRPFPIRSLFTTPYQHQQQPQIDMVNFLDQLQPNKTTAVTKRHLSTSPTTMSNRSRATRHVRFKPQHQLATVREYRIDTSEKGDNNQSSSSQHRHQHHPSSSSSSRRLATWYPPFRIHIPESCQRNINTHSSNSNDTSANINNSNRSIKIIPLFEIDTDGDNQQY